MRLTLSGLLAFVLLVATPLVAEAQPAARVRQVAWLSGTTAATSGPDVVDAFRQGLSDHGWVDGRNVALVYRYAAGQLDRLPELAAELVRMKVDVIVATAPAALAAARSATKTIPIVMIYGPDPVEAGLVVSLARPGGNITGLTSLSADLGLKQLEYLKQLVPGLTRVAILWNPGNPWHVIGVKRVETAARGLGIAPVAFGVRSPAELGAAFATMTRERTEAILSLPDPMTFTNRAQLAELALRHRLPMMNGLTEYTEAGGLASYWPNTDDMHRRAASYVDRILGGARPGDLPIEQPTKFELVINMKTARALGMSVPLAVLARADKVIE